MSSGLSSRLTVSTEAEFTSQQPAAKIVGHVGVAEAHVTNAAELMLDQLEGIDDCKTSDFMVNLL